MLQYLLDRKSTKAKVKIKKILKQTLDGEHFLENNFLIEDL